MNRDLIEEEIEAQFERGLAPVRVQNSCTQTKIEWEEKSKLLERRTVEEFSCDTCTYSIFDTVANVREQGEVREYENKHGKGEWVTCPKCEDHLVPSLDEAVD